MSNTVPSPGPGERAGAGARPVLDVDGYAGVLAGVDSALVVADAELLVRYVNPAARRALEQVREHLPYAPDQVLGLPLDRALLFALETASPGDHRGAIPLATTLSVGDRTLELDVRPITDASGRFAGAIAHLPDVTDRVALEQGTARLRSMMENSPTNMMFADRDFVIRYVNPASLAALRGLEAHLPVPAEQVVGSSLDLFHAKPAYQRGILSDPTQLPRRTHIGIGPETIDLLVSPIEDEKGDYIGAMATWQVVTGQVRAERERDDAAADSQAVNRVLAALHDVTSTEAAVRTALDTVRDAFGWAYGSYWSVGEDRLLHFVAESGDAGAEFKQVTLGATFAEGVGLSGRTWAQRELYFTQDIGEMTDCVRAPAAQRAGVRSGICFPIIIGGDVVGTMDFFATETLQPSPERLEALRNVGRMVSQSLDRLSREDAARTAAARTAEGVAQILGVVRAAAGGDLTRSLGLTGEDPIAQVGRALDELVAQFRRSMTNIGDTAETLGTSSAQLSGLAGTMGEGAALTSDRAASASGASVQVSSSIQTVATAAEEMTASIREIAQNATEAAGVATSAVEVADGAQQTVASLGESSARIGQVVKVITSIAQQTNLLALNATIEAARAGDAGKGFAVVANEVKELAKETAKATEDISGRIDAIQADTRSAVAAISRIAEVIGQINAIQTTIASAVEEQTATTNEIARSVTEAAAGADGITADITQVAATAAENRSGAEETLASAGELSTIAAELRALVGRFTL